jgi:hypothetical protein
MNPFHNLEKENKPERKLMTPSLRNNLSLGTLGRSLNNKPVGKPSSVSKFVVFNPPRPSISKNTNSQISKDNNIARASIGSIKDQKMLQGERKNSPVNFTSNIPLPKPENNIISSSQNSKEKLVNNIIIDLSSTTGQPQNVPFVSNIPLRPMSKSKRKFTEIQKEKEQAKKELQSILTEFISLYDSYIIKKNITDEEFIKIFEVILSRDILVNFSKLLPETLSSKGSCLLENTKFFILYIKFKILEDPEHKLTLDDFIRLIDNCLLYDQNDMKLIYNFFTQYVGDNYKKEEIMVSLERKQGNLVTDIADLNEDHFKYLLSRPESFLKFELDSILGSKYKNETLSKKMKLASINSAFKKKVEMPKINLQISEKKFNAGLVEESLSERVNIIRLEDELEKQAMSKSKLQQVHVPPTEIIALTHDSPVENLEQVSQHGQVSDSKKILNAGLNIINEESPVDQSNTFNNISVHEISQVHELREDNNPIIIDEESPMKNSMSQKKIPTQEINIILSQSNENKSYEQENQNPSSQTQSNNEIISNNLNNFQNSIPVQPDTTSNNKLSLDAQIYYEELILKNKIDLEIEKSSLTFNKKTPKNKNHFKMDETVNFSIIPEVHEVLDLKNKIDDVKMHQEEPEEPQDEIVAIKSKNTSRRAKSSYRPTKKKNISEEEEEKTAEDIESDTKRNKNNKSVKNKKRYQSDKKGVQQEKNLKEESSEEEMPKEDSKDRKSKNNKKKKTKTKDAKDLVKEESPVEEDNRRRSNITSNQTKRGKGRSVSASAKESEEEEQVVMKRGRDKSKVNKKDAKSNKSKTAEKKKKKK